MLQTSKWTRKYGELPWRILRRRGARFHADPCVAFACRFRCRFLCALCICLLECVYVGRDTSSWKSAKLSVFHGKFPFGCLLVHFASAPSWLLLCFVCGDWIESSTSANSPCKRHPDNLCIAVTKMRPWKSPVINYADTVVTACFLLLVSKSIQVSEDEELAFAESYTIVLLLFLGRSSEQRDLQRVVLVYPAAGVFCNSPILVSCTISSTFVTVITSFVLHFFLSA